MASMIGEDNHLYEWVSDVFVGRGLIGGLSFDGPAESHQEVSRLHAAITWNAGGRHWEVRDLGSANETRVDGVALEPGRPCRLARGCRVELGRLALVVQDISPPAVRAWCEEAGQLRIATDGVLALPDEASAEIWAIETDHGWFLRTTAAASAAPHPGDLPLENGRIVRAGGRRWRVWFPSTNQSTSNLRQWANAFRWVFRPDSAGQRVQLELVSSSAKISIPWRRHHRLLLTLAQARLEDRPRSEGGDGGWRFADALATHLRMPISDPTNSIELLLRRARNQLNALGLQAVNRLIERDEAGRYRLAVTPDQIRITAH